MSDATERLERYLADVVGGEAGRLDNRLSELDDLEERATALASDDVPVLSALANETRYGLARALVEAGAELCVCELHPLFDVSEGAVSHALSDLVAAGLVERREDGRWRHYEATERAERLFSALDAVRAEP